MRLLPLTFIASALALGLALIILPMPEVGLLALSIAFIVSFAQILTPLIPRVIQQLLIVSNLQIIATTMVSAAFIILIISFMVSDFSLALVAEHSHSTKPLIYKISGTWGNHEGSLLLWILILVIFGGIAVFSQKNTPPKMAVLTLSVQAAITTAFLAFCLFTSSPFDRLEMPPFDGNGLNPVLQDIGLALHPPMLYLGYVGLSMSFSIAIAALINGNIDRNLGAWMRPWALGAWVALTIGIALGSWWAYYELGWGGWWFWDPVENASLMPWLMATALIHSVIVTEKQGKMIRWTILLAILAFALSLVGTFIVRSGLLTSVHSFASSPARGIFVLAILILSVGIPLFLFAIKGAEITKNDQHIAQGLSRYNAIMINNVLLVIATIVVIIGTFYPLILEIVTGARITVGPPYFNASFNPIMGIAIIVMGIAPLLLWKGGLLPHGRIAALVACCAIIAAGIFTLVSHIYSPAAIAGFALIGWLATALLGDIQGRLKCHQPNLIIERIRRLGLPIWGVWLGHLGVVFFLAGAMGSGVGGIETNVRAAIGDVIKVSDRQYRFLAIQEEQGKNYVALTARLQLEDLNGNIISQLNPQKRFYPVEAQSTTEAAIHTNIFGDDYAVLGDGNSTRGYSLRLYKKPFVVWIWGGAGVMALGGIIAMIGRRRSQQN